jgi:hypothetical protein
VAAAHRPHRAALLGDAEPHQGRLRSVVVGPQRGGSRHPEPAARLVEGEAAHPARERQGAEGNRKRRTARARGRAAAPSWPPILELASQALDEGLGSSGAGARPSLRRAAAAARLIPLKRPARLPALLPDRCRSEVASDPDLPEPSVEALLSTLSGLRPPLNALQIETTAT